MLCFKVALLETECVKQLLRVKQLQKCVSRSSSDYCSRYLRVLVLATVLYQLAEVTPSFLHYSTVLVFVRVVYPTILIRY